LFIRRSPVEVFAVSVESTKSAVEFYGATWEIEFIHSPQITPQMSQYQIQEAKRTFQPYISLKIQSMKPSKMALTLGILLSYPQVKTYHNESTTPASENFSVNVRVDTDSRSGWWYKIQGGSLSKVIQSDQKNLKMSVVLSC